MPPREPTRPRPPAGDGGVDGKSLVLAAVDLVQLIGQTVALKRRGKDYVGLCPFHSEKTPSFYVSPAKQVFFCQGCKAGGSAFDFVMKRDRVEFREALHLLAREHHIDLPEPGGRGDGPSGRRQALLDACTLAGDYFARRLRDAEGQPARAYLQSRGFTGETAKTFGLGYAPDAWDGLPASRELSAIPPQVLLDAGLTKRREHGGGTYDVFRGRVMFPIRDEAGRTIAFGGRVMPGSDAPAKYLNSPETPLFSKSRSMFGIDRARQAIVSARTAVVVEGYTDVVMAHQYGVRNVVSVLGTALTAEHVQTLRRFADRVVLLFDADAAGSGAAERGVELYLTQPVEIAIATLPDGLDPDELLLRRGVEGWAAVIDAAQDALAFQWSRLRRSYDAAGDLTTQQQAIERYLRVLADARGAGPVDPIRWGAAVARVSRLTDVSVETLLERFGPAPGGRSPTPRTANRTPSPDPPPSFVDTRPGARRTVESWVLGLILNEPHRWATLQADVGPDAFAPGPTRALAERLWEYHRNEGEPTLAEFVASLRESYGTGDMRGNDSRSEGVPTGAARPVTALRGKTPTGGPKIRETSPDKVFGVDLAALALEAAMACEGLDPAQCQRDVLAFFRSERGAEERRKLLARLRRTDVEEPIPPEAASSGELGPPGRTPAEHGEGLDEVSLLRRLQDQIRGRS